MNKFKKLISISLALILCLSLCFVMASADISTTQVILKWTYLNDAATEVRVNISTSELCGAIQGTLTYDGVTYKENSACFIEATTEGDSNIKVGDNKIDFVIVTDELSKGDSNWATFDFAVSGDKDIELNLTDVSICDINATDIKSELTATKNITVIAPLRSLGSQFRKQSEEVVDALRFGSDLKVDTNNIVTIGENKYTAVSCGYVIGYDFYLKLKNGDTRQPLNTKDVYAKLDTSSEEPVLARVSGKGAQVFQANYYMSKTENNMIYTYAIKGFYEEGTAVTQTISGKSYTLAQEDIAAVPYVIYFDGEDNYDVEYGAEIMMSYDDAVTSYNQMQTTTP